MKVQRIEKEGKIYAIVESDEKVIIDARSMVDVLISAKHDAGTKNIAISKELFDKKFFDVDTGVAYECLRRCAGFGGRIAIYGDFAEYRGKPFEGFIYDSNRGNALFFVPTAEDAIIMLTQ